jgi:xylan 1,4-beta-xylosidase
MKSIGRDRRRAGRALITAFLALASPARGQAPATITVDGAAAGIPLQRVWAFYGYDEVNYTTDPEGQALLGVLAAANTAPVYVRSHFLLNTGDGTPAMKWGSTNVYSEDASGNPVYSWTLTDGILDTITRAGAFPFVEIAFTPQALSPQEIPYRNSGTTTLDGACFYPPTDYAKWAELIREWARHADERYPNVATSWLWELWNEPDIGYWHGTFEEFAKLYDYTEAALHEVLPTAALGGPSVARVDGSFLNQFLEHCANGTNGVTGETGTRLDLVTFHAKGGVFLSDGDRHIQMDLGNQLRLHRSGFDTVASFPRFKRTPIYITEADPDGCAACPADRFRPENGYRNSTAYGAYEVAMMKRSLDLAAEAGVELRGVLTWAFTFPGTPYFAGYRALATNGIGLPVLGAFKLLGRLAGTRVPLSSSGALALDDIITNRVRGEPDIDGIAARDGALLRVLVWNYHDDLVPVAATPVRVAIKLPSSFGSSVRVSHLRVDDSHGNAHGVWTSQGMPATPSAGQIAALEQAMEPSLLVSEQTLTVNGGSVDLDFDLPRFAISLITLEATSFTPDTSDDGNEGGEPGGCDCAVSRRRSSSDAAPPLAVIALVLTRILRRRRGVHG